MNKDLRKGRFNIQVEHEYGTDTIGAEAASLELAEGALTFKAKIRPVDRNQRSDIDRCRDQDFKNLKAFWFHDAYIYKRMLSFVKAYSNEVDSCFVEIEYGQRYRIRCDLKPSRPEKVRFIIDMEG